MYYLQNPVHGLAPFRALVAQLVEHPPGVRKVMGSNPIGDSDFFPSLFMYVSTIPLKMTKHVQQPLQNSILFTIFPDKLTEAN